MKCNHDLQQLISEQSKEVIVRMEVIDWLLHPMGYRRSGRTHALAIVYIKQAFELGFPIHIKDHISMTTDSNRHNRCSFREIASQIVQIMKRLPSLDYAISQQAHTLVVTGKLPLEPIVSYTEKE